MDILKEDCKSSLLKSSKSGKYYLQILIPDSLNEILGDRYYIVEIMEQHAKEISEVCDMIIKPVEDAGEFGLLISK
jgi:hypothetical protein